MTLKKTSLNQKKQIPFPNRHQLSKNKKKQKLSLNNESFPRPTKILDIEFAIRVNFTDILDERHYC